MAARKRRALARTMAVSTIRNGRLYFCRAAWRTISKSRLTSGWVSKSCSCGCCRATAVGLVRAKLLGRSPIRDSPNVDLRFWNVADGNVVHAVVDPGACHDDLLLLALRVEWPKKSWGDYRDDPPPVKGFFCAFLRPRP